MVVCINILYLYVAPVVYLMRRIQDARDLMLYKIVFDIMLFAVYVEDMSTCYHIYFIETRTSIRSML